MNITLIGVYDNPNFDPELDDRFVIVFKLENGEVWEIVASEDGEVFFALDITTANEVDNGKRIKFEDLPQIVQEQTLLEWLWWDNNGDPE